MPATITIYDTTTVDFKSLVPVLELVLKGSTDTLTVRELIRARVLQEVEEHNRQQPEFFHSLVRPTEAEQTLNGFRMPMRRQIDAERQADRALEAFETNGFIVLVDDRQVENLDDTIQVSPETLVSFLKLVPLVGG